MSDFPQLAQKLEAIASTVKTSEVHWISTPDGMFQTNNGNDWCRDCGYYMTRHLRRRNRRKADEYFLDGGWRYENDGHSFCAGCGCQLLVTLNPTAVDDELHYYRENGINQHDIATDAFCLDLLLHSTAWDSDEFGEVLTLARTLVSSNTAQQALQLHNGAAS